MKQGDKATVGGLYKIVGGVFGCGETVRCVSSGDDASGALFEAADGGSFNGMHRVFKFYCDIEPVTEIVKGELYTVVRNVGVDGRYFRVGEVVRSIDGETGFQSVSARLPSQCDMSTIWYAEADAVEPYPYAEPGREQTPAEKAGLEVGKLYKVIDTECHSFTYGEKVTFTKDDGSDFPVFTRVSDGKTQHVRPDQVELSKATHVIAFRTTLDRTIIDIDTNLSEEKIDAIKAIVAI